MSITLVASVQAGSTNNDSVTTADIVTTGANFLWAVTSNYRTGATVALTDSKGNTWTELTGQTGGAQQVRVFYCNNSPTVGAGHNFTATPNGPGDFPGIVVLAFSGVGAFGAQAGGGNSGVTSLNAGSLTPTVAGALVLGGWNTGAGTGPAVDGGFTAVSNPYNPGHSIGCTGAYLVQGSAAAAGPTLSWAGPADAAEILAWFAPAAGTNATGYSLGASPGSVATGTATTITASLSGGTTLSAPLVITLADSLASTISGTITIAGGATTGTATVTPTAAGTHSLTATHTGGGFSGGDGSTTFAATSAPVNATGYTLAASPGSVATGTPSTITASLTGGTALSAPLVITLSDGLASTISGTITINNGATTGTATVNPSATGTHAITATHTGGGFAGGDGSTSFTATAPVTINIGSSAGYFYPKEGWRFDAAANAGGGAIRTVNGGNYLKFGFTTTSVGDVVLNTDPAVNGHGAIAWRVDGGGWTFLNSLPNGTPAFTLIAGLTAGSHELLVMVVSIDYNIDHWTPTNALGIYGFTFPSGTTLHTPTVYYPIRPKRALFYGDSITEGVSVRTTEAAATPNNNTDATVAWPTIVGPALNAEYSVVAFGFQGYTHVGSDTLTPAIYVEGNDGASAWNKYSSGQSRLDGSNVFLANSTEPLDYVVILQGTNDRGADQTTVVSYAQGLLPHLRTAAPAALLCQCVPFAGYCKDSLTTVVHAYQATYPSDVKARLIDITPLGGYVDLGGDSLHPTAAGQGTLGEMLGAAILNAGAATVTVIGGGGTGSIFRPGNFIGGAI